ncbi:unnamed protein product [Peniophora sp. CBMAI 1063]|nr:unnamed protein product [Peniophora sp. CBMAI 1063]
MISDGTCAQNLQVVFPDPSLPRKLSNGASVRLTGKLTESPGKGQDKELVATSLEVLGDCDPETYPIQKQALTTEYLREHAHLRPRAAGPAAVLRLRDTAMRATQGFFERHDFCYTHTPITTTNDAEGAGETFRIASMADDQGVARDFFGLPAFLTVSSQLHLEAAANALARVWTLSPCFRAERSQTNRHLAEFWMLEAEWAFTHTVHDICDGVEDMIKDVLRAALASSDSALLWQEGDTSRRSQLEPVAGEERWARMTYTEAIDVLAAHAAANPGCFKFAPEWGRQIQSEHEHWLAGEHIRGPVFVTDYPASLKPFYMRANEDGKTVACFDLLVPGVGELVGGSLREERADLLESALRKHGLDLETYGWYLDLRKYGGAPHGGFGLGFERLISWISGIENAARILLEYP